LRLFCTILLLALSAHSLPAQEPPTVPEQGFRLTVTRGYGWNSEASDTLVIATSGQGYYVGAGYAGRHGVLQSVLPASIVDTAITILTQLLVFERDQLARRYPPGTVRFCEIGPGATFTIADTLGPHIFRRQCYPVGDTIDDLIEELLRRDEWRPAPQ